MMGAVFFEEKRGEDARMKMVYTGFAPFDGEEINPSYLAVSALPKEICGAQVICRELPTAFDSAAEELLSLIKEEKPDVVIATGQAGGRAEISLEYVAINHRHARIPDNEGKKPEDSPILPGEAAAYFSLLPLRSIEKRCKEEGIPAFLSYSAGTYVCNEVMYRLLHFREKEGLRFLGGFIHVPYCLAQVARMQKPAPSMDLSVMTRALMIAGEEALKAARQRS